MDHMDKGEVNMLLDKIDNYISEVEKHDRVWREVTASGIDFEQILQMDKYQRDKIIHLLDEKMINKLKKLEEGGLIWVTNSKIF